VLSNTDSTAYDSCTSNFAFPLPGMQPYSLVDGRYRPCRKPTCTMCHKSPQAFTIHYDCFKLFEDKGQKASRLWMIAARKHPWRRAPLIEFCTVKSEISKEALFELVPLFIDLPLPLLINLPLEILDKIRDFSPDAILWRHVAVLRLIEQISGTKTEALTVPINQISSWERGIHPVQIINRPSNEDQISDPLKIIRLTLDSRGIRKLERGHCTRWKSKLLRLLLSLIRRFKILLGNLR